MNNTFLQKLLTAVIAISIVYATCSFIAWSSMMSEWHSIIRGVFIVWVLILAVKAAESDKKFK